MIVLVDQMQISLSLDEWSGSVGVIGDADPRTVDVVLIGVPDLLWIVHDVLHLVWRVSRIIEPSEF